MILHITIMSYYSWFDYCTRERESDRDGKTAETTTNTITLQGWRSAVFSNCDAGTASWCFWRSHFGPTYSVLFCGTFWLHFVLGKYTRFNSCLFTRRIFTKRLRMDRFKFTAHVVLARRCDPPSTFHFFRSF